MIEASNYLCKADGCQVSMEVFCLVLFADVVCSRQVFGTWNKVEAWSWRVPDLHRKTLYSSICGFLAKSYCMSHSLCDLLWRYFAQKQQKFSWFQFLIQCVTHGDKYLAVGAVHWGLAAARLSASPWQILANCTRSEEGELTQCPHCVERKVVGWRTE